MSAFAVAAFHDAALPVGAAGVDAVVWIRAAGIAAPGVDVSLRVWTPAGAALAALHEIVPGSGDLLERAIALDDRTSQFAAGRWSDGVREYGLSIALPARTAGDEMLAARVDVVVGDEVAGQALVAVTWIGAAPPAAEVEPGSIGESGSIGEPAQPADAAGDLPTGAPTQPHRSATASAGGEPCPGCGAEPDHGDRYCEACGRELGVI